MPKLSGSSLLFTRLTLWKKQKGKDVEKKKANKSRIESRNKENMEQNMRHEITKQFKTFSV